MKIITKSILSAGFISSFFLFGCANETVKPENEGAFAAISVENMDTMIEWYQDVLDAEIVVQGERPPPNGKSALLRVENGLVEIQARLDASAKHGVYDGIRNAHEAYGVFKTGFVIDDLDSEFARLDSLDVNFAHGIVETHPDLGMRTFTIVDPEGNMIQFFGE